jgi:hypothetical protein
LMGDGPIGALAIAAIVDPGNATGTVATLRPARSPCRTAAFSWWTWPTCPGPPAPRGIW